MSLLERSLNAKNPTAKKLFQLMHHKQTNLSVSLDVTSAAELLAKADLLGPEICVLKTHIDIVEDFTDELITDLLRLAQEHQFLIFEDRKFADIGNTVKLQYEKGLYHIVEWSDMVNAHIIPGPGVIEGLKQVGLPKGRGLLLLAEMSSEGNLATGSYTKKNYEWADQHDDFVIGFIGKGNKKLPNHFVVMTPGIHLSSDGDTLGQQYQSPQEAVESGTDVIIVGRGILESPDLLTAAQEYRQAGWEALSARWS